MPGLQNRLETKENVRHHDSYWHQRKLNRHASLEGMGGVVCISVCSRVLFGGASDFDAKRIVPSFT